MIISYGVENMNKKESQSKMPKSGISIDAKLTDNVLYPIVSAAHSLEATKDKPPYNKLPNYFITEKDGFRLQSKDGKDLGALVFGALHRNGTTPFSAQDGHRMTVEDLLEREYTNVQRYSLDRHQRLPVGEITPELKNQANQTYGHFEALVKDNKLKNGWRSVGFAAGEMRRLRSSGRGCVNMYYLPTVPTKTKKFADTYVVKDGYRAPLREFIFDQALKHIGAQTKQDSLFAVADAPTREYNKQLKPRGYKALKPDFGVPSLNAKSPDDLDKIADNVHIIIKAPSTGEAAEIYKHGVPLGEALELLRTYIGEGYKWSPRLHINAARAFARSAVMTPQGPVVPYMGTNIQQLGGKLTTDKVIPYIVPPKK